jgi:hypothetical protein
VPCDKRVLSRPLRRDTPVRLAFPHFQKVLVLQSLATLLASCGDIVELVKCSLLQRSLTSLAIYRDLLG